MKWMDKQPEIPDLFFKYWAAQELLFHPHCHQLEPTQWWPGEGPTDEDFKLLISTPSTI